MHVILINDKPVCDQSCLRMPSVSAVDLLNIRVARVANKIIQVYKRENGKNKRQCRKKGKTEEGSKKMAKRKQGHEKVYCHEWIDRKADGCEQGCLG